MKIYITRHGETLWNIEGKFQGSQNSDLSERGVENAKKLGKSLASIDFDRIYSSPLGRAFETAKYIRGDKDTEIVVKNSLKEMSFGIWEGMENSKVEELYPEEKHYFWNEPHMYSPVEGGESYQELIERASNVLNEIIENESGENILIVAHAAVIKAMFIGIKNLQLEDFWSPPFLVNNCLSILEVNENGMELILEADVSCLED